MSSLATIAIVGAGASAYTAKKGSDASKESAQISADGQVQAAETVWDQYKATESRLQPYTEGATNAYQTQQDLAGLNGAGAQQSAYDNYTESPGVAWAREQGLSQLDNKASAGGQLYSGNRQKALVEYSQGLATQGFGNYEQRLANIVNTGQQAENTIAGYGGQAASNQAGYTSAAANTTAQGNIAAANAQQQGYAGIAQAAGSYLGNFGGGGYGNVANAVGNQGTVNTRGGGTVTYGPLY